MAKRDQLNQQEQQLKAQFDTQLAVLAQQLEDEPAKSDEINKKMDQLLKQHNAQMDKIWEQQDAARKAAYAATHKIAGRNNTSCCNIF